MGYIDVPVMKGRKWYSFKNYLIRPLITGTLIRGFTENYNCVGSNIKYVRHQSLTQRSNT